MDSLTQIVLGAAVGEIAAGKRVGNRAMLWGAIGGTIPDLDVFANLVSGEISALAFHRAITHSIPFALLTPMALGWLTYRIYRPKDPGAPGSVWLDFLKVYGLMVVLVLIGTLVMPIPIQEGLAIACTVGFATVFFHLLLYGRELLRRRHRPHGNTHWRVWAMLFFWAIFTHPLLDACTTYGTQLFQPFWDYRVAFNTISVADPVYTLPFLIMVIAAACFTRRHRLRYWFNLAGLLLSSTYLVFTFYNKIQVDRTFRSSLQAREIDFHRFTTSPTILNNILWSGVAEGDTAFYYADYSLLDSARLIPDFQVLPKGHELIAAYETQRDIEVLRWFSKDYFIVRQRGEELIWKDLRFGKLPSATDPENFVFNFILTEKEGKIEARQNEAAPEDAGQAFQQLWERMLGQ